MHQKTVVKDISLSTQIMLRMCTECMVIQFITHMLGQEQAQQLLILLLKMLTMSMVCLEQDMFMGRMLCLMVIHLHSHQPHQPHPMILP